MVLEPVLLLQRTWMWFQALISGDSQPHVAPVWESNVLSGLLDSCTYVMHTSTSQKKKKIRSTIKNIFYFLSVKGIAGSA